MDFNFESVNLQVCSLTVIIFLSAFSFLFILFSHKKRHKLPPGPRGLPIFGNLFQLKNENLAEKFREYREKYGDVFSLHFGSCLVIVVNGYDTIKEVFHLRGDVFSERPHNFVNTQVTKHFGILSNNGKQWKEQRAFGIKTLRYFGVGKRNIEQPIIQECGKIRDEINKQESGTFDPSLILRNASANIISAIAFGTIFDYGDVKFLKVSTMIRDFDDSLSLLGQINAFPILHYFPIDVFGERNIKKKYQVCLDFVHTIIEEHKATYDKNDPRDLIDLYLVEMDRKSKEDSSFTNDNLSRIVLDFFLGGTELITITLRWFIAYLINFPNIQEKLNNEVISVLGSRSPSMDHKNDMPFMCAFLEELQRIANVALFSLEHGPSKETTILGYTIPKDAVLIPNLNSVAFDPTIFPDPMSFKPERFIDENGHFHLNEKNLPFGIGPRSCMGESLARSEIFLFASFLVQNFKFVESEDGPPSLKPIATSVFLPHPYKIKAIPRE